MTEFFPKLVDFIIFNHLQVLTDRNFDSHPQCAPLLDEYLRFCCQNALRSISNLSRARVSVCVCQNKERKLKTEPVVIKNKIRRCQMRWHGGVVFDKGRYNGGWILTQTRCIGILRFYSCLVTPNTERALENICALFSKQLVNH